MKSAASDLHINVSVKVTIQASLMSGHAKVLLE